MQLHDSACTDLLNMWWGLDQPASCLISSIPEKVEKNRTAVVSRLWDSLVNGMTDAEPEPQSGQDLIPDKQKRMTDLEPHLLQLKKKWKPAVFIYKILVQGSIYWLGLRTSFYLIIQAKHQQFIFP